ncbi:MAG: diaminopimelate dehydrogenase [Acutalibacteraceae bacterium]
MIRIGIAGYGNLGKGVEAAVKNNADMELIAVFTRRDPSSIKVLTEGVKVLPFSEISQYKDEIDVMINCGGSATDLPQTTPEIAKYYNVIDSFDTHAKILEHMKAVGKSAQEAETTAIISVGWDPGMFSLNRLYMNAVLPCGNDYTFWGKGVSQGHSDAIRRIDGVVDARQYTCPVESAVERVRNGENPTLSVREKHTRVCYVVAQEGADKDRIENEIKTMPNYFADYDTTVNFISLEELHEKHMGIPHGGSVIRSGFTGMDLTTKHTIEYSLKLESNPEFTGSVLAAYARAAFKMNKKGDFGCKTVFDVAPAMLTDKSAEEICAHLL